MENMTIGLTFFIVMSLAIIGGIILAIIFSSFFVVQQQEIGIVERLGKFNRIKRAGFHLKIPIIERIKKQSLKVQQLNVNVESKTSDNVFVTVQVSVQYKVPDDDDKIYKSVYELTEPEEQMKSYIFDIVRAEVPRLSIDEIFNEKSKIAMAIKKGVGKSIEDYGYIILEALITDIKVDERIQQAMNDIVASEREKIAVIQRSEAKKIEMIKAAEAEAEAKKLQGTGIANQREEIIRGFRHSIEDLKSINIKEDEILKFVLLTQYFDTLKDVAASPSNTIMLPGSPKGFSDFEDSIREAMISSNIASNLSLKEEKTEEKKEINDMKEKKEESN